MKLDVLVVDDEYGMRLGVQRSLHDFTVRVENFNEPVDFTITLSESGEEAIERINSTRPDILLLDHKLPGMTGLDVLERINPASRDMVILFVTAYASIETAIAATKSGAFDFLPKPFTPGELKHAIRKATGHLLLRRQAKQLAEEKRQVRFHFIRVLGHELKAPINAVEGYLQMIRQRTLGDRIEVYDTMLERSVIRLDAMRKLIADLLDMTRIESGLKERQIEQVDLHRIAIEAIETALPAAQQNDVRLQLHVNEPVRLHADAGEIGIVLNNLISNAVKYNRTGGQVDLRIEQVGRTVTITVSDTGIGMTETEIGKLFTEFTRIKNRKTTHILGSGLGLSIVKKVAELYGGRVSVSSRPDEGSTFTITLCETVNPAETDDATDEAGHTEYAPAE